MNSTNMASFDDIGKPCLIGKPALLQHRPGPLKFKRLKNILEAYNPLLPVWLIGCRRVLRPLQQLNHILVPSCPRKLQGGVARRRNRIRVGSFVE
jgi:hypothetical protein